MKYLKYTFFALGFFSLIACGDNKPKTIKNAPTKKETPRPKPKKKKTNEAKTTSKETEKPTIPTPPEHLEKAKQIIAAVDMDKVAAVDAKKKYKQFCAACHGFKGNLMVNGAKDLTQSKISLVESVAQVYFGKGLMNPHKGLMDDEEIVAVAQYIETLRE